MPGAAPDKDESKKYIRTFAGDMEAVQKENVPDPAPLGATTPPKPAVTPPTPALAPTASIPPPPVVTSALAPPQNPPLETYSNDFSERVKRTRASTATILAAEQDSLPRPPHVVPRESSPVGFSYLIVGAVLFIVSIAGAYAAYQYYAITGEPITPAPAVPTPIFVDEREEISGASPALLQAITASAQRPLPAGTVRLLYVASTDSAGSPQATGTVNVFSALPLSAPDVLLRNLNTAGTMAGVVNVGGVQSPFFILSISSYSNVFSGMLSWEPLMPSYLAELFPSYARQPTDFGGQATSSTVALPVPPAVTFVDVTVANHDVRAYRDASDRDVLVYGFWNQATLVIARDAAAFTEIIGRLATFRAP